MSWKPILWLVACVVLTGLFIGLFERGSKPSAHSLPVDMPLLHLSQDSVTHLSIVSGGDGVECVRRDGQWFLVKPVETRADSAGVNRLVSAILAMRKQEVIDLDRQEKRKLTLASFGLESPRARLRIGSDFRVDEILVGDSSPLRNTVYVRLNDGTDVIGITCQVSEILPLDAAALQDRAAFPASIRQAVRLEVKHPGGFFQLALRDGSWRIQQPYDALADGGRVERLLQSLSQLTIADFGGTNGLVTPETCGLGGDETALQVSVWPLGQRDPFVLTVGKPRPDNPSWLYARISDGERICAVGKEVLSLQNLKAESLRDRRICDADPSLIASVTLRDGDAKMVIQKTADGGWIIVEPFRFAANIRAVGALLKAVCGLQGDEVRLAGGTNQLPLEVEGMSARLAIAYPLVKLASNETATLPVQSRVWTYRLLSPAADASGNQAFREETRTLYRASSEDVIHMRASIPGLARGAFADPLPYMECRMLDLNPTRIRKISLSRQGREETVTVNDDGVWSVESPPEGQISEGAVPALLEWASNLQAERVECAALTNAPSFGLDESAERVTFGVSGGGIQKTLLIGRDNGQGGVFSMVQGQDVVFVLKRSVTESLMRPLVKGP